MKTKVLPNGDLEISVDRETQRFLKRERKGNDAFQSDSYMYDVFEWLICNSEYTWIRAWEIGALTSAPILGIRGEQRPLKPGENADYLHLTGSDGENVFVEDVEKAWGFMAYALRSPQDDLADDGKAVFQYGGETEKK